MTGTLNHDPTTPAASYDAYTRASAPSGETTVAVAASPAQAPTPRHTLPVAIAAPATRTTATFFDPWNSSSTGHQRAENRLSTSSSWRVSRSLKLREQFKAGRGGGKRVADTVGAGRDDAAPNARKPDGQKSLAEVWRASKTAKRPPSQENDVGTVAELTPCASGHNQTYAQESHAYSKGRAGEDGAAPLEKQQLFVGLCFYLNGSTAPLVSDHKLKQILATHGASHSITLGRRTVTHVILGTVNSRGGAGGGLAATKIHKEIARTGGKTVKFISADWVLDSISANRRLPESRYSPLKLAPKSQDSILSMMRAASPKQERK
ncbi:hypothetical protein ACJQWK_07243 [Exserohilum turcicum]